VDAPILETSGFGIMKDKQQLVLLRKVAASSGLIVFTDSDGAGFVIRNYLKGAINPANNDYIKTSNYSARPVYLYQDRKQVFDKYEVSNNIIVHTKSIDKIAQMIDKSLTLGATNVDSLNFSLSEKDKYCDELLAKATSEVVKRANVVAGAAGTSVDGVKSLGTSCSLNQYQAVNYARNSLMMAKSAVAEDSAMGSSSPIEAGVIKVYSTVNCVFRLK
jgi:uncharacterized protein YggE